VPPALKLSDVEIAQVRNLDINGLSVRQRKTDPHAWHRAQDDGRCDWRLDLRGPGLVTRVPTIR
jgi:hypothetical protein